VKKKVKKFKQLVGRLGSSHPLKKA